MSTLTEYRTLKYHYYIDEEDHIHGEYKRWYNDGSLAEHSFYVNDERHGECVMFHHDEDIKYHYVMKNDLVIMELDMGISLTDEDKFEIILKHGHMEFLP